MKIQAAVVITVMTFAASVFAADTNDASSKTSGFHVANAVWVYDAPSAPEPANNAPASALAASPIAPSLAAQTAHGFMPLIKNAIVPQHTTPTERKAWFALSLMSHGAAAFDAYSTNVSISSGHGYERNPLMKPFAGSAAVYPAAQVLPFGFDFLSRRMMRSDNSFIRHTWWVPQLAGTVGSAWVGVRNLHVAQ